MSTYRTMCVSCKHFEGNQSLRPEETVVYTCAAFPREIPEEYMRGQAVHDVVTGDEEGQPVAWEPKFAKHAGAMEAWKRNRAADEARLAAEEE